MNDSMLSAALEYAKSGFEVFPVKPDKSPQGDVCPNGLKDASSDPKTVRRYWERHPEANIAIRPAGGVAVIDIESVQGHGVDGFAQFNRLTDELGPLSVNLS